jgi:hypothetical protein
MEFRACWVMLQQQGDVSTAQQLVDAIFHMCILPKARATPKSGFFALPSP